MVRKFLTSEHVLVPKHMKASEKEKAQLYSDLQITDVELPKIMKKDPALKGLGAKPGDLIKIVRKSPTAGDTTYYRVVIRG